MYNIIFQSVADPGLPEICGKNAGQHGKTYRYQ